MRDHPREWGIIHVSEGFSEERPPWDDTDLPNLSLPNEEQRNACGNLTLSLIDWIREYEVNIVENLGIEYRQATLAKWENGKRPFTPADRVASTWLELWRQIAANGQDTF